MKNRIVTMYPYSPTFTHEYRITHLVYYLSRMFNTDPKYLVREQFIPSKIYRSIEIEKSLMFLKYTRSMYENLFWFASHSPLKPIGKLTSRIKRDNLGKTIFDFFDDDFYTGDRLGKEYCKEGKKDYYDALKNLFSCSLTLFIFEEHKNYYQSEGFEIDDYLILPNASDPNLFKKTPLPKTKVIGHIGSFPNMQMSKISGLFLLLDAFELVLKKYKNAKLLLCGNFGLEVKKIVQKRIKGWDTEIYWERVPHYWIPKIFQKCYLYVRPTSVISRFINKNSKIYASASGLDAAASARPVVSTSQNAIINNNGLLCDTTSEDIAEKICRLIGDQNLATKLGLNGRAAIEKEHNWENRAKVLYEHLISIYGLERAEPF